MRVLITGGAGLLGQALVRGAPGGVEPVVAWRSTRPALGEGPQCDLTSADRVERVVADIAPNVVVHTASTMGVEADIVAATRNVARACAATGCRLIHLSTDALFDGLDAPYAESAVSTGTVNDYGRWKAEAEQIVTELLAGAAVVRTSLLVSVDPVDPRTAWVADAVRSGQALDLFVDELRCPIAADDLAAGIWEIAEMLANGDGSAASGVWHLVGREVMSRYTLGVLVAAAFGLDPGAITAALVGDHPTPRVADARLLTGRADRELRMTPRTMAELFRSRVALDEHPPRD